MRSSGLENEVAALSLDEQQQSTYDDVDDGSSIDWDTEERFWLEEYFMNSVHNGEYDEVLHLLQDERGGIDLINNSRNYSNGRTSIHIASIEGHYNIMQLLLENCTKTIIDCQEYYGDNDNDDIDDMNLLPRRRDIRGKSYNNSEEGNILSEGGWTALHFASSRGRFDVVQLLIRKGASIFIQDRYGRTAEDVSIQYNYDNIAKFIHEEKQYQLRIPTYAWLMHTWMDR